MLNKRKSFLHAHAGAWKAHHSLQAAEDILIRHERCVVSLLHLAAPRVKAELRCRL